jgi:addiction module HigA family antidote
MRIKTHPGEVLNEELLKPMGISARALAEAIGVPANRITGIINGTRAVTADTALRLARHFGTTAEFWTSMQAGYDLSVAERAAGKTIAKIKPRELAAA